MTTQKESDTAALETVRPDADLEARIEREISRLASDRLSVPMRVGAGIAGVFSLSVFAWIAAISAAVTDLTSTESAFVIGVSTGFLYMGALFLHSARTGTKDLLFPFQRLQD